MEEKENKKFSTREWWMFILLIVLIQWLIHFWSTEALSSSAMVNYVSFAGTLASTILAVLAIIYSFVQSASQQTTSETISREVHRLQSIVSEVNASTSKVNESLEKLPLITEQLENIPSTVSETINQGVSPLTQSQDKINNMLSKLMSGSESSLVTNKEKGTDIVDTVDEGVNKFTVIPALSLGICAHIILHDKSITELHKDFTAAVSKDSVQIVNELFLSARSVLLCLCMQSIFKMDYNKLARNDLCSDDQWDKMKNLQGRLLMALSRVVKDDGLNDCIPRDLKDKINSIFIE
ncbi:TPA: hypothetical protein ACNU2W_000071 [Aeromonas salmonicida subsp. pectinolytica]